MSASRPFAATPKKVNPPLAYPGNKAKIAPFIIDHIPEHETYVEVFGGTAGVLFNKKPSRNEVVNDADGDVHNFLKVLRDKPDELREWLEAQPYCERDYKEWKQRWHDGWMPRDDVVCAGVFFFLRRASFGSDMGGFRAEANGRRFSPRQFNNAVDRLDDLSDRLRDVMLLNRDFEEVIRKYASSRNAFIYMDPPYLGSLHRYKASLFNRRRFSDTLVDLGSGDLYDGRPSAEWANWMVSSASVPSAIELFNTVETDCVHEINNDGGTKEVAEKITMNYEIDEEPSFTGDIDDDPTDPQTGLGSY